MEEVQVHRAKPDLTSEMELGFGRCCDADGSFSSRKDPFLKIARPELNVLLEKDHVTPGNGINSVFSPLPAGTELYPSAAAAVQLRARVLLGLEPLLSHTRGA